MVDEYYYCSRPHCTREVHARGWCRTHYEQWLKSTNPVYAQKIASYQKHYRSTNKSKLQAYDKVRNKKLKLDPGHKRKKRANAYKRMYGISIENYEQLLAKQDGKCAICLKRPVHNKKLHVDHNHNTQKVRGLLCAQCNWYMGKIDSDPSIIERITKYVRT